MPEHILFLTGHMAEPHLRKVLAQMGPVEFSYEVLDIGISVAGLMSAELIARRVSDPRGADRILVPGLCAGDLTGPASQLGVPVERGPDDLKDLPEFFGHGGQSPDLSHYEVRIFAEIVEAPDLDLDRIRERAARYHADGADVIDLGCLPGRGFPHLEEAVTALREEGYAVSVDSLEPEDLLRGGRAGADYLLSLKESTLWIAEEVGSVPVVIPEEPGDLDSLIRACRALLERGREFLADPVLDPIHFGFVESLVRYSELRDRLPEAPILMGTGNITELTEADTVGMVALLAGIMSELRVDALLSTQVSPHARTVVRESDVARRILYAAREDKAFPKGYGRGLTPLHERRPFPYNLTEVREVAEQVRDPNYRIQVVEEGVQVYNRNGLVSGTDPLELFSQLERLQGDAPHAFYMGMELARAQIAWQLGKRYSQDEELDWGAASHPGKTEPERDERGFPKVGPTLTASRRQRRGRSRKHSSGGEEA